MTKSEDRGRKPDWRTSLSQLDAWVMEEEAAVTRSSRARPAPQPKTNSDAPHQHDGEVIDARKWPRNPQGDAEKHSLPTHANGEAGVVGLGRDGAPLKPAEGLFTAEEEAFITQMSVWLRGRPNADVILEEVWHLAVGNDVENPDDVEEAEGTEEEAEDEPTDDTEQTDRRPRSGSPEANKP